MFINSRSDKLWYIHSIAESHKQYFTKTIKYDFMFIELKNIKYIIYWYKYMVKP